MLALAGVQPVSLPLIGINNGNCPYADINDIILITLIGINNNC